MLIDALLKSYADDPRLPGSPIRGSRLGECGRRLAYELWPHLFPPEPLPPRRLMVFEMGHLVERQLAQRLRRVFPGQWGFEQERFYFQVPLSVTEADAAAKKMARKELIGAVVPGFRPAEATTSRLTLVLDPAPPALWIAVHPDGVVDAEGYGLTATEIKSYSSPGFRRVLQGRIDYSYRVQLAVEADATALDNAMFLTYRKETSHLLELFYSRKADHVAVTLTKTNGVREVYRAGDPALKRLFDDVEGIEVRHPFEPGILEQARARVRRVLLATPNVLPPREYGPEFRCAKCRGEGFYLTPKRQDRKECKKCAGTGWLEETPLPFPCSYCPVKAHCWPIDRAEIAESPKWYVKRAALMAEHVILPPEAPEPEEEADADDEKPPTQPA